MTDVQRRLGIILKQLRQKQGITQQEFADKAKLHRTYISDVERGVRNLSIACLNRMALSLETPLSEIFRHAETIDANRNTSQAGT